MEPSGPTMEGHTPWNQVNQAVGGGAEHGDDAHLEGQGLHGGGGGGVAADHGALGDLAEHARAQVLGDGGQAGVLAGVGRVGDAHGGGGAEATGPAGEQQQAEGVRRVEQRVQDQQGRERADGDLGGVDQHAVGRERADGAADLPDVEVIGQGQADEDEDDDDRAVGADLVAERQPAGAVRPQGQAEDAGDHGGRDHEGLQWREHRAGERADRQQRADQAGVHQHGPRRELSIYGFSRSAGREAGTPRVRAGRPSSDQGGGPTEGSGDGRGTQNRAPVHSTPTRHDDGAPPPLGRDGAVVGGAAQARSAVPVCVPVSAPE